MRPRRRRPGVLLGQRGREGVQSPERAPSESVAALF